MSPLGAISHQSMAELSDAFADVYPMQSRCFPSGDQIGKRTAVKFDPTRCGWPPATGTTQTVPLSARVWPRGSAAERLGLTQVPVCFRRGEERGERFGFARPGGCGDFSAFQKANVEAEERCLMPRYVEDQFVKASREIGLKVEPRAKERYEFNIFTADWK
jgi:hypothetical protein